MYFVYVRKTSKLLWHCIWKWLYLRFSLFGKNSHTILLRRLKIKYNSIRLSANWILGKINFSNFNDKISRNIIPQVLQLFVKIFKSFTLIYESLSKICYDQWKCHQRYKWTFSTPLFNWVIKSLVLKPTEWFQGYHSIIDYWLHNMIYIYYRINKLLIFWLHDQGLKISTIFIR